MKKIHALLLAAPLTAVTLGGAGLAVSHAAPSSDAARWVRCDLGGHAPMVHPDALDQFCKPRRERCDIYSTPRFMPDRFRRDCEPKRDECARPMGYRGILPPHCEKPRTCPPDTFQVTREGDKLRCKPLPRRTPKATPTLAPTPPAYTPDPVVDDCRDGVKRTKGRIRPCDTAPPQPMPTPRWEHTMPVEPPVRPAPEATKPALPGNPLRTSKPAPELAGDPEGCLAPPGEGDIKPAVCWKPRRGAGQAF